MTEKNILIINGPNLNLLGKREPELYGKDTLDDINKVLSDIAQKNGFSITAIQSNFEGEIVTVLQNAFLDKKHIAIIINAAAYTHTSVAILDSLKLFTIPVIEVHLTDPETRETFRHYSYIREVASAVFKGEGKQSYIKALDYVMS